MGHMGPGSAGFERHLLQVEQYLESQHQGSWHITLNNTTPTPPKDHGGPSVTALTRCKSFTRPRSADRWWQCLLDLPNSFEGGDGLRFVTLGTGDTKSAASEQACRLAFSRLLVERPEWVLLRGPRWKVPTEELMKKLPLPGGPHHALPVHVNARRAQLANEAASERYTHTEAGWAVASQIY